MADSNASDAARRRLALAERRVRELEQRVDQEVRLAQRALEETLKARQERDEYRRVLAAALANEKQALTRAEAAGTEVVSLRARLEDLTESRAAAQAHAEEAEARSERQREDAELAVRRAEERAWALSEEHGRAMQKVVAERAQALGRLRELEPLVPVPVPESLRAARQRARFNLAAGLVAALLAVVVLPGAIVSVFQNEGALHMGAITGMTPGQLVLLEAALVAVALGLGSWGLHELRLVEREADAERRTRKAGEPQVGIDPSGSGL
jgi:hypothetical protein